MRSNQLRRRSALRERLLRPEVDGETATWDAAVERMASRLAATIAEHGPASVAMLVSDQLSSKALYLANKLAKGFLGTANIDVSSRQTSGPMTDALRQAFGDTDFGATIDDLDQADTVVIAGADIAKNYPAIFERLAVAQERRGVRVVVVDPYRSATADAADLHLAIRPGSDAALFNGLLSHLAARGLVDAEFVATHTSGFFAALTAAQQIDVADIAALTGVPRSAIFDFFETLSGDDRVVTIVGAGPFRSRASCGMAGAILDCHLATGRIGKPGAGIMTLTGRELGLESSETCAGVTSGPDAAVLPDRLAGSLRLDAPHHRRAVTGHWKCPAVADKPGITATELAGEISAGRIKAVWIIGADPAGNLPASLGAALSRCPFVAVSDIVRTATVRRAHVLLPATECETYGDSNALGDGGRPDWRQIADVASRMGFASAFTYGGPKDVDDERAALVALDSEIKARDAAGLSPGRRARFMPAPLGQEVGPPTRSYPLALMVALPIDDADSGEPLVEIDPEDADTFDIVSGTVLEIDSACGTLRARAVVTSRQLRGHVRLALPWAELLACPGAEALTFVRVRAVPIRAAAPASLMAAF